MWEQMNFIWGMLHVRYLWSARWRNIACPEFRKGIWAKVTDLEIENADLEIKNVKEGERWGEAFLGRCIEEGGEHRPELMFLKNICFEHPLLLCPYFIALSNLCESKT